MMNQLAVAVRATAAAVPGLLRDLAGLSGVGLVAYGAWLIYPPAGFIVGGASGQGVLREGGRRGEEEGGEQAAHAGTKPPRPPGASRRQIRLSPQPPQPTPRLGIRRYS